MKQFQNQKKCSRRRMYYPIHRPCLDSSHLPIQRPYVFYEPPQILIKPSCFQSWNIPLRHCVNKNHYSTHMCRDLEDGIEVDQCSCTHSQDHEHNNTVEHGTIVGPGNANEDFFFKKKNDSVSSLQSNTSEKCKALNKAKGRSLGCLSKEVVDKNPNNRSNNITVLESLNGPFTRSNTGNDKEYLSSKQISKATDISSSTNSNEYYLKPYAKPAYDHMSTRPLNYERVNINDNNDDDVRHFGSSATPKMSSNGNQMLTSFNNSNLFPRQDILATIDSSDILHNSKMYNLNSSNQSKSIGTYEHANDKRQIIKNNKSNQCCLPPYTQGTNTFESTSPLFGSNLSNVNDHTKTNVGTQTSMSILIPLNNGHHYKVPTAKAEVNNLTLKGSGITLSSKVDLRKRSDKINQTSQISINNTAGNNTDSFNISSENNRKVDSECCGRRNDLKKVRKLDSNCQNNQKSSTLNCACTKWTDTKGEVCNKNVPCTREIGSSTCASVSCVMNKVQTCGCRYPPSFKHYSCVGKINGTCECNEK